MLKNISNLGKTLNKAEQKTINGGKLPAPHDPQCSTKEDCGSDVNYTDPVSGLVTCYNVTCGVDQQCHFILC